LAKTATADDVHRLNTRDARVGTVAYMSPEQVLGEGLDSRSDVFSFGVVLYEMATGKAAFHGATDTQIFTAILHTTPPPASDGKPDLRRGLDGIVARCLEKNRDRRYQSASELRIDLERVQRQEGSHELRSLSFTSPLFMPSDVPTHCRSPFGCPSSLIPPFSQVFYS
jgi:serine/threonine protein kinase